MSTLAESIYVSNVNLRRLEKPTRTRNETTMNEKQKDYTKSGSHLLHWLAHGSALLFTLFVGKSHPLPSITVDLLSWFCWSGLASAYTTCCSRNWRSWYQRCQIYTFPTVYLRSITDTVDASIRTLLWLTGVQTGLVFSYSAAQSCPTLTKLWFSLFLSVPVSCCRW